jgi:hypothetical protein
MVSHARKTKKPARNASKKNYKHKGGSNNDDINDLDISGIYGDDEDNDIHEINEENDNDNDDVNFEDGMEDSLNTTRESLTEPNIGNINPHVNYDSDSGDMDSLHLSDLDTSNISSANTTMEDTSFGGKKTKRKKTNKSKKRITRKSKKTKRKTRKNKTRKNKRGGNVDKLGDSDFNPNLSYDSKQNGGQNIGSNCEDPNFSIYNTNLLKLSPYKP